MEFAGNIQKFSPDRGKYDLRVKSYQSDKRQLDVELRKAIERIKQGADRDDLFAYAEGGISLDQVKSTITNGLGIGNIPPTSARQTHFKHGTTGIGGTKVAKL